MGQTQIWPQIGPIKVPRPPHGSNFHETDQRNLIFGIPEPLGAKLGEKVDDQNAFSCMLLLRAAGGVEGIAAVGAKVVKYSRGRKADAAT